MTGRPSHREIGEGHRSRARRLRLDMTEPERRFWHAVREHRFLGLGFRRQVPIAGYIADFVCHRLRLVVEIDGHTHGSDAAIAADEVRTARLAQEGYRVLRFWNNDIMTKLEGVLARLGDEAVALGLLSRPSRGKG